MDEVKKPDEFALFKEHQRYQHEALAKAIDDILWYQRMNEYAIVDKVSLIGPPPVNTKAQPDQEKGNPVIVKAYTFIPRGIDRTKKYPLMVYVHGGVHANHSSGAAHIIRELMEQEYIVIAPDYRGSTGYGETYWKLIDYGGLENEDVFAARNWMIENEDLVDPDRVGIMGWSHGGMITLMNLFSHPTSYKVGYAGVPVSDLVARMGYKGPNYHSLFAADYHIGKTAYQDPYAYKMRSPAWHAHKLETPLLVHTSTNDEDVNVLEVEHLIKALKAANKDFEYKIYDAAPGGHVFNRIDTKLAKDSRREIYQFLARYLNPPKPAK